MVSSDDEDDDDDDDEFVCYARLGRAYAERERTIKLEIAAVSLLWLVGCPVLCSLPAVGRKHPQDPTDYGKPIPEQCELLSYSVSASMTGLYPKVLGSLMATLFAVLVVQRTSNGLCSNLKLGWMARFSPLVSASAGRRRRGSEAAGKGGGKAATLQSPERDNESRRCDDEDVVVALKLWDRIERIEFLGYLAGSFLVALVTLDAKNFPATHMLFAALAFLSLSQQNRLIGALGRDFGDVFPPRWSCGHAELVFRWGMVHLGLMYGIGYLLGTAHHFGRCGYLLAVVDSFSVRAFGNPTTLRVLASVAYWSNEYAFAFTSIYIQLLQHYELQLWEFAGAGNMPFMGIVSRFSIRAAAKRLTGGLSSDAHVFMGMSKPSCGNEDATGRRQKTKVG